MKCFKILFATCLIVLMSTTAFAWGALEQGILWGIGGTVVTQQLLRPNTVYVQAPGYAVYPYHRRYVEPYHAPCRPVEPIYQEAEIYDPICSCYKTVLIRIN